MGVDIGGTFTDSAWSSEHGLVAVGKTLTTPDDPSQAVETVLARDASSAHGIPIADVAGSSTARRS